LDAIQNELEVGKEQLQHEQNRIQNIRQERAQGVCWMYVVIVLEVLLFILLLRWGFA
jgi:hypothetical protein